MNFNSIITKINFIFVVSILLFIFVFFSYYKYEEQRTINTISEKYLDISKNIHEKNMFGSEIIDYTKKLNFVPALNLREIIDNSKPVNSGPGFDIFMDAKSYYLHLHVPEFRLLLKDNTVYKKEYYGFILIASLFIVFIFSIMWILKALRPLKDLKLEIEKFSKGDLNINCKSDGKDEIAQVANEFDNAVKEIALLLESRQLFLRTVMHELKTPIAKGRIVSELIEDEKQKNRMIVIFEKLNLQINDFAKVEQIVSKNYHVNKGSYSIDTILDTAIQMLMLEDNDLDKKIEKKFSSNEKLDVDLELIALAIKNLLDNGIKYSIDKKVIIKYEDKKLLFISNGEKLLKPLEEHFKPFHNESKLKNHGMGLGLYIVHSIISMHNMKLEYQHQDNLNIFKIY
ncbi:MAG: two-component system OmpR family sensor kinase [Sulfurimonas sp.]|jgi:two-component system OmpR family sensor kinase